MKEISIDVKGTSLDFHAAQSIAKSIASEDNPDTTAMAWFDKKSDRHSPSTVECNSKGIPGWEEYGRNHGGRKKISINEDEYIFIYT